MNKKLLSFAMVFLLSLSFTVNTYAMDKRVKSSKSWTVTKEITKKEAKENKKYWKEGYLKGKAQGYVYSKKYHYANVVLFTNKTSHDKESGRTWGSGKVSVDTYWDKKMSCFLDMYYAHVYYGFES